MTGQIINGRLVTMPSPEWHHCYNEKCYKTVRQMRWPYSVRCPHCTSNKIVKTGKNHRNCACQRYKCKKCGKRFDDLTGTIFTGHHQSLPLWLTYLYLMGLNVSNRQDEYAIYSRLQAWGYGHKTVNYSVGEYARDEGEISQEKLPIYLRFFEFVYNVRRWGKALLDSLIRLLLQPDVCPQNPI